MIIIPHPKFCELFTSVADLDPSDFGLHWSVSVSQSYGFGSGYGSFYHQAKLVRKTLIPTILWLLWLLKNDVLSKSNKQQSKKKIINPWKRVSPGFLHDKKNMCAKILRFPQKCRYLKNSKGRLQIRYKRKGSVENIIWLLYLDLGEVYNNIWEDVVLWVTNLVQHLFPNCSQADHTAYKTLLVLLT